MKRDFEGVEFVAHVANLRPWGADDRKRALSG